MIIIFFYTVKLSKGILKYGCIRQMVTIYRLNKNEMHCEEKLNLRSHNTSDYLIKVVTKAGLTVLVSALFRRIYTP